MSIGTATIVIREIGQADDLSRPIAPSGHMTKIGAACLAPFAAMEAEPELETMEAEAEVEAMEAEDEGKEEGEEPGSNEEPGPNAALQGGGGRAFYEQPFYRN